MAVAGMPGQAPAQYAPAAQYPAPAAAAGAPKFSLANGAARFGIVAGQTIDLAALFPGVGLPPGTLAEVTVNPQDPSAMGLKNMTAAPWSATTSAGTVASISPGRNVRLVADATIRIGAVEIIVQAV